MIDKKPGVGNTIIGDTIIIRGNVQGDEDLTIKGRVEGSITLTKDLFIETSGIVKADVNVQNIFISGVLVGNVTASQLVEISADGRMVGNINAPRVVIVDGASYRGRIEMGEDQLPGPRLLSDPPGQGRSKVAWHLLIVGIGALQHQ